MWRSRTFVALVRRRASMIRICNASSRPSKTMQGPTIIARSRPLFHHSLHFFSTTTTTTTTTSSSIDDSGREWSERFSALKLESLKETRNEQDLIAQWAALLNEPDSSSSLEAEQVETAVAEMRALFDTWIPEAMTRSSAPFEHMLDAYTKSLVNGPLALGILQKWKEALDGDLQLAPAAAHYNSVLTAYAAMPIDSAATDGASSGCSTLDAAEVALEIIEYLEQVLYMDEKLPNIQSYQSVVRCLARSQQDINNTESVASTFDRVQSSMDSLLQKLEPRMSDEQFFALANALSDALQCWSIVQANNQKHEYSETSLARRNEWLMHWNGLVQPGNADLWLRLKANGGKFVWITVLDQTTMAILKLHHRDLLTALQMTTFDSAVGSAEHMTRTVLQLEDMMANSPRNLPSARHYQRTIQAWGHVKNKSSREYKVIAQQQQDILLERMQQQHNRHNGNAQTLDEKEQATVSWNQLLQAHADAGRPGVVKELFDANAQSKTNRIFRNQETYTILLQSLAQKRDPDEPMKAKTRALHAHAILRKLVSHDPAKRIIEPTAAHYASVMIAWSRGYHRDGALYCQELFDAMEHESRHGNAAMTPSAVHYTALITTWGFSRLPGALSNIMEIYERMRESGVALDVSSYTAVLFALSRSETAAGALQADQILQEMEQNTRILGVVEAHCADEVIKPSLFCYNAAMYAWGGAKDADDAYSRCEAVFRRLTDAYEESGRDASLRPNSTSYMSLIEALPVDGGGSLRGPRAEALLDQMEARAIEGQAELPDAKIYTAVMKAHWKDDQPEAPALVEAIVKRMKESYEAGNLEAKPDVHAMTVLLQTWAKSDAPNKAVITWEILEEMRVSYEKGDMDMMPNAWTYAACLNACAFTRSQDKETKAQALKVALNVMNALDKDPNGGLNEFTFRNMFQVLNYQIDDMKERTRYAGVVFQRCCQEGYVSKGTIDSLKRHVPTLYNKLPVCSNGRLNLPSKWARHVAKRDHPDRSWSV